LPRLAILGCRGIPARYGGFETFAEELATRLVARGFAVTVFCPHPGGAAEPPRAHAGVRLEYVRVPALGPASALVYDIRSLRRARAEHEVVYLLGYGAAAFLGLGRRPGNELWVNMDGLEWRRAKWGLLARAWLRRAERAALAGADRVIFDSAAVQRAVLGDGPSPRASVIAYGAELASVPDPEALRSLGLRTGGYFLLVARVEPENHVREILRAHARSGSGRELLVVGDVERAGRYGAACRAAAGPGARFLGALFDARILATLRRASAATLHGHSVGGTNPALLEALAAGALVVAHDNPFNREVLEERALYFRDEAELVAALRTVGGWSDAERARRAAEGRARIAERYTWEHVVEAYAALLAPERGTRPASVPGPSLVDVPAPLPQRASPAPAAPSRAEPRA
jgi:glycosyltransferase involved in cell wall biosynthesis